MFRFCGHYAKAYPHCYLLLSAFLTGLPFDGGVAERMHIPTQRYLWNEMIPMLRLSEFPVTTLKPVCCQIGC